MYIPTVVSREPDGQSGRFDVLPYSTAGCQQRVSDRDAQSRIGDIRVRYSELRCNRGLMNRLETYERVVVSDCH